jgi:hypothetical protein
MLAAIVDRSVDPKAVVKDGQFSGGVVQAGWPPGVEPEVAVLDIAIAGFEQDRSRSVHQC